MASQNCFQLKNFWPCPLRCPGERLALSQRFGEPRNGGDSLKSNIKPIGRKNMCLKH